MFEQFTPEQVRVIKRALHLIDRTGPLDEYERRVAEKLVREVDADWDRRVQGGVDVLTETFRSLGF